MKQYNEMGAEIARLEAQIAAKDTAVFAWQDKYDAARTERDALVLSTGEHVTKRSEYLARAEKAERERDELRAVLISIHDDLRVPPWIREITNAVLEAKP